MKYWIYSIIITILFIILLVTTYYRNGVIETEDFFLGLFFFVFFQLNIIFKDYSNAQEEKFNSMSDKEKLKLIGKVMTRFIGKDD